jgi:tetratricopeptide (TPR) repeat protein/tRNA A-37 threonylcarbamoyl transferase component Bud32
MTTCPPKEAWNAYLMGRLGQEDDRLLTEHMQDCAACEATFAGLIAPLRITLADGPPEAAPPELIERLRRLWDAAYPTADLTAPERWPEIEGYEIVGVLGKGATSIVYKARQLDLGREVALKMMAAGQWSSAMDVGRLLHDATTAAQLRHDNIIPIHAVGQHRGLPYCVMEAIAGGTLAERITDMVREPRQAARLIATVARALHYAHMQGVYHRDVKPANILLRTPDQEQAGPAFSIPLLTDFGLASRTRDETGLSATGIVMGTPGYMAPEQIRSGEPTAAADIYGLGAVLYECLTGQPPCRAATPFDTLLVTLYHDPERPRALNSRLHRDLETICLKCLEKDPSRRYASAAALADDLERWLRGEPVRALLVGPVGRAGRWCRRKPWLAGLASALVLVVMAGVAGIGDQWWRAEVARRQAVAARSAAEASDAQAQQMLSEFLQSSAVLPMQENYYIKAPAVESLQKAEKHCENFLQNKPDDTGLRIALTKIRGDLATLYLARGHVAEADAYLQSARSLWEPLAGLAPHNAQYRGWLATTCFWQAYSARSQGRYAEALQYFEQAHDLWQELAAERPEDVALWEQVGDSHWNMIDLIAIPSIRQETLHHLEENQTRLGQLVQADSSNALLRNRLALTCLLLGEVYFQEQDETKARPCWQQAYEHYRILARGAREDLPVTQSLARCCYRLMRNQPSDPYYLEAVMLYKQSGPCLAVLVDHRTELAGQHPEASWLRRALLENYCLLARCHWNAGQTAQALRVIQDHLRDLTTLASKYPFDTAYGVSQLDSLLTVGTFLREAKQPGAALPLGREAARLADQYAVFPWRNLWFSTWLATRSLQIAALLRQLKDPGEALRQAEQGRRLFQELCRTAPDDLGHKAGLSEAWQQIGKARWDLGLAEEALTAFRDSAEVQRQHFERAPTIRINRVNLSRCYDRLADWSLRSGNRTEVAAALRQREQLWPDNAEELKKVAIDFEKLADLVGALPVLEVSTVGIQSAPLGQGPLLAASALFPGRTALGEGCKSLTSEEQVERQLYLAERDRARRAEEDVVHRAGGAAAGAQR